MKRLLALFAALALAVGSTSAGPKPQAGSLCSNPNVGILAVMDDRVSSFVLRYGCELKSVVPDDFERR
jgi:hypothetical protein